MDQAQNAGHDSYRLIVTRRNASEVLLLTEGSAWSLPSVEIHPRQRIAAQLGTELDAQCGCQGYCLFVLTPEVGLPSGAVMEVFEPDEIAPQGTSWKPLTRETCSPMESAEDRAVIEKSIEELDICRRAPSQRPFARPGWLSELFTWAQQQLHPTGLCLNGSFTQLNASPTFSLIRLETRDSAVWFKATGEPKLDELPITLLLARLFPEKLPTILGVHRDWNGWLSEEVGGTTLDQCPDQSTWEQAAEHLAELEIASIGESGLLLDAHCRDLRLPVLIDRLRPFLAGMAELMASQEKQSPPPLTISELDFLSERLQEALLLLQHLGFPPTLGHLDFNPGNIVVTAARCVFLDWAEACVTHPLVTFEYLREHARRCHLHDAAASVRMTAAYLQPWEPLLSPAGLAQALAVSPLVAVFTYAVASSGSHSPEARRRSARPGYLRSLTRRMHREAVRWGEEKKDAIFNRSISNESAVLPSRV